MGRKKQPLNSLFVLMGDVALKRVSEERHFEMVEGPKPQDAQREQVHEMCKNRVCSL